MPGRWIERTWASDPTLYAPARYRRGCRYRAFVPDPLSALRFRLEPEVAGIAADAEAAIRALNDVARPALLPLARLLLRTESIASSKVEGMQMGVRELARAEARMEAGGSVGATALEVIANVGAMTLAVDEAAAAARFGVGEILSIHRRLMAASPTPHLAGRLRTTQNWIGGNDYSPCGADFVPPPPEQVTPLLEDLCDAIAAESLPPVVQAALVHAQFETIHPFDDGNGRTGRALIHVVFRRRHVAPAYVPPVSVLLAAARERYVEGLTGFRGEDVGVWIERFAGVTARAALLAEGYLRAVQALTESWRAQLRTAAPALRSDAAAWTLIDVLPAHPLITAPVAAAATGRSKPSVYQAIAELEGAGVLVPLSASKRNRVWEAVGLLDLLAGLEAGRAAR